MKIEPFKEINPPDQFGYWTNKKTKERFGGQYISPLLVPNLKRVEKGFFKAIKNKKFVKELNEELDTFIGVNTPILFSPELTRIAGGEKKVGRIYLKRTDLHTSHSHKPISAYSCCKLAKYLGFKKILTETGAFQNGRAVASACAALGLDLDIYVGLNDSRKLAINKDISALHGANIIEVHDSTKSLLPAMAAALRAFQSEPDSMYVVGSCAGPAPYPLMVRTFASVIGRITKKQFKNLVGKDPSTLFAVCGGGSNFSAIAYPYYKSKKPDLYAVESAGDGIKTGRHGATIVGGGKMGILLGMQSKVLLDGENIAETYTAASGLDFSSIGPEVAYMHSIGKVKFLSATDLEAKKTFMMMARKHGLICAIEACYVIHAAIKEIKKRKNPKENHLIHLCGSGEPNVSQMMEFMKNKR
jgi:tryptophan synthase beta chain